MHVEWDGGPVVVAKAVTIVCGFRIGPVFGSSGAHFVNFAILIPHVGQFALSIDLPLVVVSLVTLLSSTSTFFLHLTQYID